MSLLACPLEEQKPSSTTISNQRFPIKSARATLTPTPDSTNATSSASVILFPLLAKKLSVAA
ncbi:Uncharacterised protein [Chlamydia trachomatis]|nr:Uncharacterised protein [Chlamydia trachomatis]